MTVILSRARNTDPSTSKQAATINLPGKKSNAIKVLWTYRRYNSVMSGLTAREVETKSGVHAAHKRVSDLHQLGLIENKLDRNGEPIVRDKGEVLQISAAGRRYLIELEL